MKKVLNKYTFIGIGLLVFFLLLMILVKFVDKGQVGQSVVGLSSLNKALTRIGTSDIWDTACDGMLYISIIIGGIVAVIGVFQFLLSGYKFQKIDKTIILFVIGLVILIIVYLFFDKVVVINRRPNGTDAVLDPSFPSSHILLVSFVAPALAYILAKNTDEKWMKYAGYGIAAVVVVLMFVGRIVAGAHYFTDAVAGAVFGIGLFFVLVGVNQLFIKSQTEEA